MGTRVLQPEPPMPIGGDLGQTYILVNILLSGAQPHCDMLTIFPNCVPRGQVSSHKLSVPSAW